MRGMFRVKHRIAMGTILGLLLARAPLVCAQEIGNSSANESPHAAQKADLATIEPLLRQMQAEIKELRNQVSDLELKQETAQTESAELRKELEQTKAHLASSGESLGAGNSEQMVTSTSMAQKQTEEERITKIEENQQLVDAKIAEQSQTKVESGSKYRVRLSGIVLFNTYGEHGQVDNTDFPELAIQPGLLSSNGTFGASVRQSQIGIQAFGPTIAGARTSADIQFDFAGGFPETQNGVSFGFMRLRTGTVRFDWTNTSIVGGQDSLFFAPLSPTSIATLAIPALAYSGNLWSWTPQIRVEHKFTVSESSSVSVQAGILDNLTGDVPPSQYNRYSSWGEDTGQPAYATRLSWTGRLHGQDLTIGAGGYYGRQLWGYGRTVDGWAGTIDLRLPLGQLFEFTSQFYRGRGVGGIGGGLGQSVLWDGPLFDPSTEIYGLNSVGGWAQLKYRATSKLQFNGAFGQENPFASDLREFGDNGNFYSQVFSKNQTVLANFIYKPRSDFMFSLEYRRLKTFILDGGANSANLVNVSVGYIF